MRSMIPVCMKYKKTGFISLKTRLWFLEWWQVVVMSEFLTIKQLSEYLNVKPKTLYSWVGKRVIPFYQIQGVIRFRKTEIDQWLQSCSCQMDDFIRSKVKAIENDLGF